MDSDPFKQFQNWYEDAGKIITDEYRDAFCLATVSPQGTPEARMMLLKGFDETGFTFYTNLHSNKGLSLEKHPRAAMTFFWKELTRQVRIEGATQPVSAAGADAYFSTRPRGSQIGAWASAQSSPLPGRKTLEERITETEIRFSGKEVARPPFWSGFCLVPERIEFWQGRPDRLHERTLFIKTENGWMTELLYP